MRQAIAALLLLAAVAASPPAQADETDVLFDEAVVLIKEGKFEEAYPKLLSAWEKRQSFDVAANLGLVENKLGKKRDAAAHLDYALATFPTTGDAEVKERMQAMLTSLRAELGRLQVDAPEGCVLKIDGEERGRTPLPSVYLYVEPGARKVEGSRPGEVGVTTIDVKAGQSLAIKLVLEPAEGPSGGTKAAEPPLPLWPGLLVGGLGVAGLGAGIGLAVAAGSSGSNADDATAALPSRGACQGASPPASCATIEEDLETRDLMSNAAVGAFVAGGVLTAAGVALVIVSAAGASGAASDERAVVARPLLAPGFAGLGFSGAF